MSTSEKKVPRTYRIDAALLEALQAEVAERGGTVTGLLELAAWDHLKRRGLEGHLEALEGRLAASLVGLGDEVRRVGDDVQLLFAFLDQLAKFIFATTPEVSDKQAASILGSTRHAGFLKEMPGAMKERKRKASVVDKITDDEGRGDA